MTRHREVLLQIGLKSITPMGSHLEGIFKGWRKVSKPSAPTAVVPEKMEHTGLDL